MARINNDDDDGRYQEDVLEEQIPECGPAKRESGNDNNDNFNDTSLVGEIAEDDNNENVSRVPVIEEEISDDNNSNDHVFVEPLYVDSEFPANEFDDTFPVEKKFEIDDEKVYISNRNRGELEEFRTVDTSIFEAEKKRCFEEGTLFEDSEFPANDSSLYPSQTPGIFRTIKWKRPREIVENPQFIVKDRTRFDVVQGELGNCWLLAAVSVIADYKELFYRVVLPDQYFDDDDYAGIFHFQFWHFGHWIDIVIDDRLPTVDGRLIYSQLSSSKAFWSVLLEKAYAKLHGGYANLDGGHTVEGLQDFTGGLTGRIETKSITCDNFLPWLKRGLNMGSLYGATIHPQNNEAARPLIESGLASGHSYSITALFLSIEDKLIRLRDPWGNSRVWNGAWSTTSQEWMSLDQGIKAVLRPPTLHDGEFWMSLKDFWENFHQIDVCHLTADIYNEMEHPPREIPCLRGANGWIEHQKHGDWNSEECTAGGRRFQDSHHLNPQYCIKITSDDNDNDNVNVIVSLTQKNSRKMRAGASQNVHIGFYVYKIKTKSSLDANFFQNEANSAIAMSTFIDLRETSLHMELSSGEYVIVPCTFAADVNAQFLLRVFSDRPVEISKLPIQF